MTTITHRAIADRLRAIEDEKDLAVAAVLRKRKAERESLQEACEALGHMWSRTPNGSDPDYFAAQIRFGESCCICEKHKPKGTPPNN